MCLCMRIAIQGQMKSSFEPLVEWEYLMLPVAIAMRKLRIYDKLFEQIKSSSSLRSHIALNMVVIILLVEEIFRIDPFCKGA